MRWTTIILLTLVGYAGFAYATDAATTVSEQNKKDKRAIHLRKAAEHLRAAGLESLADHVHGLPSTTPHSQSPSYSTSMKSQTQILLEIKMLELDMTKMRRLGLKSSKVKLNGTITQEEFIESMKVLATVEKSIKLEDLLEILRNDGLVRVLAEPTMATVNGWPAHFHVGGKVSIWEATSDGKPIMRYKPYGTFVDFIPLLDDKGGLRLELRLKHSEIDHARSVMANGHAIPAFNDVIMETGLDVTLGTPLILFGPSRTVSDKTTGMRELTTVVFINATAVEPTAANAQPAQHLQRR